MFEKELILEILQQIDAAIDLVSSRFIPIHSAAKKLNAKTLRTQRIAE